MIGVPQAQKNTVLVVVYYINYNYKYSEYPSLSLMDVRVID